MKAPGTENLAMIAVALSGIAWGLFWVPLRALNHAGISDIWAVVVFYILPAIMLSPLMVFRHRQIIRGGFALHLGGLFAAIALVFFAGALVFTEVVRALLFYYLTPIWSTLLARLVLKEEINAARWVTIILGLLGLFFILKIDTSFNVSLNAGDWLALIGGFVWAFAAVVMKSDNHQNAVDFALSYFIWGSLIALALTLFPFEGVGAAPQWETIIGVLPWIIPVLLLLVIPPAFAVMWGATVLNPGILSIVFMTEISAGTISAAIWANEPFGFSELMGVLLIGAAGVWEPILKTIRGGK